MTLHILLYSGGVDSILCLKKAVENNIVPYIFHFWTKKLNKTHEKMIRKTARILSPNSPFYVFKTNTYGFRANCTKDFVDYGVAFDGDNSYYFGVADYLIIGYTKWIYTRKKSRHKWKNLLQRKFIDATERLKLPYIFPLADYTRNQADKEFNLLLPIIKDNTVSSTRDYDYGGKTYIPPKIT